MNPPRPQLSCKKPPRLIQSGRKTAHLVAVLRQHCNPSSPTALLDYGFAFQVKKTSLFVFLFTWRLNSVHLKYCKFLLMSQFTLFSPFCLQPHPSCYFHSLVSSSSYAANNFCLIWRRLCCRNTFLARFLYLFALSSNFCIFIITL